MLIRRNQLALMQNNIEEAEKYCNRIAKLLDRIDAPPLFIRSLMSMGRFYVRKGDIHNAIHCFSKALPEAEKLGWLQEQFEIYQELAAIYETAGNLAEALKCYRQYMYFKDEVLGQEKQKTIAEMQTRFDVESAEREKELFRVKNVELTAALEEVRRLNDNLTRLNNEKNEVMSIVAHDLKSPLAGMRMVATLLKDHCENMPVPELKTHLGTIVNSTERMLSISSGLLNAQYIETGNVYGEPVQVDISAFVGRLVEDYQQVAVKKNIRLSMAGTEQLELHCSEEALRQAMENLLGNAVKFTSHGSSVQVRVQKKGKKVVIEIQDEGPGIAKSERRKMYKKYSRLSAQPTGGESTTGLGLWITKKAVDALQGRLRCASEPGRGTTFRIELPLER